MLTRRRILQQAGKTATLAAATTPWWLVRRAHAARATKLVVWNPAALAPQVDKIMQEQCYAYAKQAGIKESEIDYSIIGGPSSCPSWWRRSKPAIPRISPASVAGTPSFTAPRATSWR